MIYVFCHNGAKRPSGGVKILFEMTQALIDAGYEAAILMPGAHLYPQDCPKGYKPSWFETTVPVLDDVRIVTSDDTVIMHEEGVWAFDHVMANKPKYLIINQGASASIANNVGMNITYEFVRKIYDGAEAVITVSPYITMFVHHVFGVPHEKIYLIQNMIDGYFEPTTKENTILVLDKTKSLATELVIKVYNERYPGWRVEVIDNYNHKQVAEAMARSKIFVFFAGAGGEGFGMPPVEAALAGCKVIGNSGVGGKFFFNPPIFTEVEYGDILAFIQEMDQWTTTLQDTTILDFSQDAVAQREGLKQAFSKATYQTRVKNVFEKALPWING